MSASIDEAKLKELLKSAVVEALEDTTGRFVIGVQWHPERGWREDPPSQALFSALIEQARLGYNGAKQQ